VNTPEHWTRDSDALDQFILRRLPDEERAERELHLAGCAECRERVRLEAAFVAGIRRFGRHEMKERLSRTLKAKGEYRHAGVPAAAAPAIAIMEAAEAVPPRQVRRSRSWISAFALAASVVIVVGVGYLNHWWTAEHQSAPTVSDSFAKADEHVAEEKAQPAPQPGSQKLKEAVPQALDNLSAREGTNRPEAGIAAKDHPRSVEAQARMEDAPASPAKKPGDGAGVQGLAAAAQGDPDEEMIGSGWVEGVVTGNAGVDSDKAEADESKAAPAGRAMSTPLQHSVASFDAEITQRPFSEAPVAQQRRRQSIQTMLAHIGQSGPHMTVTLYPETALSDRDLQRARLYRPSPDSIALTMPGKSIRFKMPQHIAPAAK
jgi:hypothetical protein